MTAAMIVLVGVECFLIFCLRERSSNWGETRQNTKRGFMQCLCNHRVDPDSPRLAQQLPTVIVSALRPCKPPTETVA